LSDFNHTRSCKKDIGKSPSSAATTSMGLLHPKKWAEQPPPYFKYQLPEDRLFHSTKH
jgi:hypothetical protein